MTVIAQRFADVLEALREGDTRPFELLLDPQAVWRGTDDDHWRCEGRGEIVAQMRLRLAGRPMGGEIAETVDGDSRVVVGFRPSPAPPSNQPLDDGLAYVVLTERDGKILEMKGCADRSSALRYAGID